MRLPLPLNREWTNRKELRDMPLPLTEKIAISIPADMKDWLATKANLENVSMAYLVRCLIEKEMGL